MEYFEYCSIWDIAFYVRLIIYELVDKLLSTWLHADLGEVKVKWSKRSFTADTLHIFIFLQNNIKENDGLKSPKDCNYLHQDCLIFF